jgi:hypothetical protein
LTLARADRLAGGENPAADDTRHRPQLVREREGGERFLDRGRRVEVYALVDARLRGTSFRCTIRGLSGGGIYGMRVVLIGRIQPTL